MKPVDINVVLYKPKRQDVADLLESLQKIALEFRRINLLVSGNQEQMQTVRDCLEAVGLSKQAVTYHRFDNIGFSSGHNFLLAKAFDQDAVSCLVLNPDMTVASGSLDRFLTLCSSSPDVALFGPTLERVNPGANHEQRVFDSRGIIWTASGRHLDDAMGQTWQIDEGQIETVKGLTGACLLVTRQAYDALVSRTGWFFDDLFLAYREDAELGVRATAVGVPSKVVHIEGFSHVRSVRGAARGNGIADLLGVRNRFLILFRLASLRPGRAVSAFFRDFLVILGTYAWERSSLPGLKSAFQIRRAVVYTSFRRR